VTTLDPAYPPHEYIGIEQVVHYAEVAERRIREASGQAIGRGAQPALDFEDGGAA